jgi:hypothetical protein
VGVEAAANFGGVADDLELVPGADVGGDVVDLPLAMPRLAMCSCASASHHAERPSWKILKSFARGVPA